MQNMHDTLMCAGDQQALARMFQQLCLIMCGSAVQLALPVLLVTLAAGQRGTKLPQDIYIARAEGDLALEEELYWALINIYRSPAVMFELTARNFARKKQL